MNAYFVSKSCYMAHLTDFYSLRGADMQEEDVKECSCDLTTLTFEESERRPERNRK